MRVYNQFNKIGATLLALMITTLTASVVPINVAQAAATDISPVPLFTSNAANNLVKPNLMLILDDSGSMAWDYMPDNAADFSTHYGYASSQCNGVYYNPNVIYRTPITATGVIYPNASFTGAWKDGYNTSGGTTNISTSFKSEAAGTAQAAYYYAYSGAQTTEKLKDYYYANGLFYQECDSPIGDTTKLDGTNPVNTLFTKVIVSATSGPGIKDINNDGLINATDKDERQNFANWYSYYRTRMLMMKTSTGLAFDAIGDQFRIGYMTINNNNGADFLNITDFTATQKTNWYAKLYGSSPNNATPLRAALSNAGLLYAGKVTTINGVTANDPVQYACQRNYTILSTDGFWTNSSGAIPGGKKLDGTKMGNEDALLPRPFYDGSVVSYNQSTSQQTQLQTRYTKTASRVQEEDTQIQKRTTRLQKKETDSNVLQRSYQWQKKQATLQKFQATVQIKQDILQRWKAQRQEQQDVLQKFQATVQVKQDVLQKYQTQIQKRTVTFSKTTTQRQKQTRSFQICNTEGTNCLTINNDCTSGTGTTAIRPLCVPGTASSWTNSTCTAANGNPVTFCKDLAPTNSTTYGLSSCTAGTSGTGLTTTCTINDTGWVNVATCTANAAAGVTCQTSGSPVFVANDPSCSTNAATGVSCQWLVDTTWSNAATCTANAGQHTFCQSITPVLVGNDPACVANAATGVSCVWQTDTTWSDVASCTVSANHRCQDKPSSNVYQADDPACAANAATGVNCIWAVDPTWANTTTCVANAGLHTICQNINPVLVGNDPLCVANVATGVSCAYLAGSGTWVNVSETKADKCTANASLGISCQQINDTGNVSVATCSATDPLGGPTVTCPTPPVPAWVNTGTCNAGTVGTITTTCQTTNPAWANASSCSDTPMNGSGADVECQTIISKVKQYVASCTAPVTQPVSGKTITCYPDADVVTQVASCDCAATAGATCNVAATVANTFTKTACYNEITSPVTAVASCTNSAATGANGFIATSCSTVTTGPTSVATCQAAAVDASNNYVQTTCSAPIVDPASGTTDTLADTAAYYYNTNLRTAALNNCGGPFYDAAIPATDRCTAGLVSTHENDTATNQHMTTYTVGLGARGQMVASPSYDKDGNPDYGYISANTVKGPTTCVWPDDAVNFIGGNCNWPFPIIDNPSTIDDLWHAAVNGHGIYFNASNPDKLKEGLGNLLTEITNANLIGAAASSAVASAKIDADNDKLYSSFFKAGEWTGDLISQTLNITTGAAPIYDPSNPDPTTYNWSAQTLLDAKTYTTRQIYTAGTVSNAGTNGLINFTWANLVSAGLGNYFTAPHISTSPPAYPSLLNGTPQLTGLTQFCIIGSGCLNTTAQTSVTVATNGAGGEGLVNFLRGDRSGEEGVLTDADKYYRHRVHLLGDIVTAESKYVSTSNQVLQEAFNPGYAAFKATNATRAPMLYTAANDGMLHAFDPSTGQEQWAYIPSFVIPRLYTLADKQYANKHQYFVEGSPKSSDVYINGQWKTILVGGLNGGGTGFYALDITTPNTPKLLWEYTQDDMGYSFGNPVITKQSDGNWVVLLTSGYDNCPATTPGCAKNGVGDGDGHLFVLDAETGILVSSSANIKTGVGSVANPSGLAKIAQFTPVDGVTNLVYSGDLQGNLWRFTITPSGYNKLLLATFKDASGNVQPITTKPAITSIKGEPVVVVGTGRYLGQVDIGSTAQQSFYAVKDTGVSYGNPRVNSDFILQQAVADVCPTIVDNPLTLSINESLQYAGVCRAGKAIRKVVSSTTDTLDDKNGWVLDFPVGTQELSFTDPSIFGGTVLFNTSQAIAGVTTVCGAAKPGNPVSFGYQVDFLTGAAPNEFGIVGKYIGIGIATAPRLFMTPDGQVRTDTIVNGDGEGDVPCTGPGCHTIDKVVTPPGVNPTKRLSWTEAE
ncbi:MAG: PilC/PilY family type IV pilus protein [Methylophilaceae bacterium]